MKRRIEQLLNGIFEYKQNRLLIRPESLELKASPDMVVHGKFFLEGEGEKKAHGFLYPSDPRMVCEPTEFQGISNEIHFQFDCSGLAPGARISKAVAVCSDCGEYEIPVSVEIAAKKEEEPLPFADLSEFAALARPDYQKAYRCFLLPSFGNLLRQDPKLLGLYESMALVNPSYSSMEEFLVGAGCKEALHFSLEEKEMELGELSDPVQETLHLKKNTWGFQTVQAESDALFVRPERQLFSTDEFAGSGCDLNLIIDTNLMHAGNNFARVTIRAGGQVMQVQVTAKKASKHPADHQEHTQKAMREKLEHLYVSFRLRKTGLPEWIAQSEEVIGAYKRAGGEDPYADLFLVQLYYADEKKHKAQKLLEQIGAQRKRLNTPDRYGFYLYLTTFFYREAAYVDRVEEEIGKLLGREQSSGSGLPQDRRPRTGDGQKHTDAMHMQASWRLQWILLYLQENLLNDEGARYEAVEEQFRRGCRSRILYVEALQILKNNPFLMHRLGEFEIRLLRFASREKVMTAELLRQAAGLAVHRMEFDRSLYLVLEDRYRLYPSEEVLKAICQLLIRGEKKENEYFPWYAKGVESGLKMTGLYEAYLAAMDCTDLRKMPQIIRMYFTYDTSMDYEKRAAIYCCIAKNRGNDPQTWHTHRAAMEKFVLEQLEAGHLSEDLVVLYRVFLRESLLTRPLAEKLLRLLFTCEIVCSRPDIRQITVHSPRMLRDGSVLFQNGRARVPVYDPQSTLVASDKEGRRYEAHALCTVRRMMESEEMLAWCAKKDPDFPGLVVFLCTESLRENLINEKLLPFFLCGCESPEFSDEFRRELRKTVLGYYLAHPREESLAGFLGKISYKDYVAVDKTALIMLLAEEGNCAAAFSLLNQYGAEDIPLMQLVRICSRMVLELEFEENAMLLSLCHFCFASGKYDDKLLRYLLLYYEGTVEEMKLVWSAACKFDLDTMLLEEKILMMLMFTHSGTQGSEPVFESYLKKMGRKKLCRAYVNLKAYEYFVRGLPVADSVFSYIEKEYARLSRQNHLSDQEEVCRLALLQYYAKAVSLSQPQRAYAEEMLEEFVSKGMRFAFYRRFDREMLKNYQMDGKVFAEYACSPESTVYISYRYRGSDADYIREPVENCFEGIFVREFTLFAGEEMECRFEEDTGQEKIRSDKWVLTAEADRNVDTGMYGVLNRYFKAGEEKDEEGQKEALESWLTLEYLAEEVFTLV